MAFCYLGADAAAVMQICGALFLWGLPTQVCLHLIEDWHSPVQALATRTDTLMVNHSYFMVASATVPCAAEDQ